MKRVINIRLVAGVVVVFVFIACPLFLNAGERTIVDGIINTSKDASGSIVAIKLNLAVADGEMFNIVLDENGKKLGIEMDGKWVEVIGEVYDRDGEKWMEVKSYKKHEKNIFE